MHSLNVNCSLNVRRTTSALHYDHNVISPPVAILYTILTLTLTLTRGLILDNARSSTEYCYS